MNVQLQYHSLPPLTVIIRKSAPAGVFLPDTKKYRTLMKLLSIIFAGLIVALVFLGTFFLILLFYIYFETKVAGFPKVNTFGPSKTARVKNTDSRTDLVRIREYYQNLF